MSQNPQEESNTNRVNEKATSVHPSIFFFLGLVAGAGLGTGVFVVGSGAWASRLGDQAPKLSAGLPQEGPLSKVPPGPNEQPQPHPKVQGVLDLEEKESPALAPVKHAAASPDQRPLKVLLTVVPTYPAMAQNLRIHGPVEVNVRVDRAGNPVDETALSGNLLLQAAAKEAASQWRFLPARANGHNVPADIILRFEFSMPHGPRLEA